jgi:hypothetical protein
MQLPVYQVFRHDNHLSYNACSPKTFHKLLCYPGKYNTLTFTKLESTTVINAPVSADASHFHKPAMWGSSPMSRPTLSALQLGGSRSTAALRRRPAQASRASVVIDYAQRGWMSKHTALTCARPRKNGAAVVSRFKTPLGSLRLMKCSFAVGACVGVCATA